MKELNQLKVARVRCEAQAELFKKIEPFLTEEEIDIFRRGRNAHTAHAHKRTQEYHYATGLEALFGYLYLSGNAERIRTLLSISDT